MSSDGFGEVVGVEFGAVSDPATPDGVDLSVPKIWDGTVVRNATPGEMATFESSRSDDERRAAHDRARQFLAAHAGIPLRAVLAAVNEQIGKLSRSELLLDDAQLLSRVDEIIVQQRGG